MNVGAIFILPNTPEYGKPIGDWTHSGFMKFFRWIVPFQHNRVTPRSELCYDDERWSGLECDSWSIVVYTVSTSLHIYTLDLNIAISSSRIFPNYFCKLPSPPFPLFIHKNNNNKNGIEREGHNGLSVGCRTGYWKIFNRNNLFCKLQIYLQICLNIPAG